MRTGLIRAGGVKPPLWPVTPALVNPAYQGLWRGLTTLIPLQGEQIPLDFLRREFASTATGDLKAGPRGYGYFTDYASSKRLQWPSSTHTDIGRGVNQEFSILVAVDEIVALNGAAGFVAHRDAFNATYWELYYDSGNINFGWSSPFRSVSWPYTLSAGDSPVLVLTRRLGGVYELWVDGVSQGIRSNPVLVGGGAHQFAVGALAAGDTSNNVEATFQMVGLWTGRALSSPEAILLSADPFGLIRPNWDYVTTEAGGTTVAVGTLAQTDSPIGVAAEKPITAPVGVLAGFDSQVGVTAEQPVDTPIGILAQSDSLVSVSGLKTAPVGVLAESDSLVSVLPLQPIEQAVGVLAEIDALVAVPAQIGGDQVIPIGVFAESDSLIVVSGLKTVHVGTLAQSDTLISVGPGRRITIATLAEAEALVGIGGIKTVHVGTLAESNILVAVELIGGLVVVHVEGHTSVAIDPYSTEIDLNPSLTSVELDPSITHVTVDVDRTTT